MPAHTLRQAMRELRRLARGAHRRPPRTTEALPLLEQLMRSAERLSLEERSGDILLRVFARDESKVCKVSCLIQDADLPRLTPCEQAVAELLCNGLTLAQTARLRGVSVNTIKSQVRQVFRKLNVDSRVALVRRLGL
jgi:DNA-binding NarL/FixJ family response regulator